MISDAMMLLVNKSAANNSVALVLFTNQRALTAVIETGQWAASVGVDFRVVVSK